MSSRSFLVNSDCIITWKLLERLFFPLYLQQRDMLRVIIQISHIFTASVQIKLIARDYSRGKMHFYAFVINM